MAHSLNMTQTGGSIGFSLAASETNQGWAERRVSLPRRETGSVRPKLHINTSRIKEKITT